MSIGLPGIDLIGLGLFLASAVRLAAPVMLAALGEIVSERAGVFNIGLEGMMLNAAFAAVVGLQMTGSPVGGVAFAAAAGLGSAAVLAVFVAVLRADQVVAGISFNMLALGLTSLLRQIMLAHPGALPSLPAVTVYKIPGLSELPVVGRGLFSQSPLFYLALVLAALIAFALMRTRFGLVLRAAGEGAAAADAAGLDVTTIRFCAMLFTGAMAGLGGGYLALAAAGGTFVDDITGGRGYLALAVVIFGRWEPVAAVLAALFFGAADALQYQGQALGIVVAPPILLMAPFVLALGAWILLGNSRGGPADLGRPFVRGRG
jgi:ABC-type uncharacterized transport system permease subunit